MSRVERGRRVGRLLFTCARRRGTLDSTEGRDAAELMADNRLTDGGRGGGEGVREGGRAFRSRSGAVRAAGDRFRHTEGPESHEATVPGPGCGLGTWRPRKEGRRVRWKVDVALGVDWGRGGPGRQAAESWMWRPRKTERRDAEPG